MSISPALSTFARLRQRSCCWFAPSIIALAISCCAFSPSHAQARNHQTGTMPAWQDCAYETCALRIEGAMVVQGTEGVRIPSLREFDWSSDTAAVNAAAYQSNRARGAAFRILGFTGTLASLALIAKASMDALEVSQASEGDMFDQDAAMAEYEKKYMIAVGISLGSSAAGLTGRLFDSRARKHLARAIWWHNRAFARP